MRVALIHPEWRFDGSIYFGCREPHLPLELGYAAARLRAAGHEALILDGALDGLSNAALADRAAAFRPDMTVVTTAPTYLFWRCAQPELTTPRALFDALGERGGMTVAVGPHGSVTPGAALRKLGCDLLVRGECEEVVEALANAGGDPRGLMHVAWLEAGEPVVKGPPAAAAFRDAPALRWPDGWVKRHHHHHHRFDLQPDAPGAEVEASRGCPYSCTFCAKNDYRDKYRRRELAHTLDEIDGLMAQGVRYLYFIDEIFLPWKELLEALQAREGLWFGVQTRLDLWSEPMIDRLGRAGCVSVEAGVESLTPEGRDALDKKCRMSTEQLTDRLIYAKRRIAFVQANLIETSQDDPAEVAAWRERVRAAGVWANDPVPLYPYPSSPDYLKLFGPPDDHAWERAHAHYLKQFARFSDVQDQAPARLEELEGTCAS
jgi:B12-binding domain/radical SAM domain protein of rhizo-twelve system